MASSGKSTATRCLGCGCTDLRGCKWGCWWLVVDREKGVGWCSSCLTLVPFGGARIGHQLCVILGRGATPAEVVRIKRWRPKTKDWGPDEELRRSLIWTPVSPLDRRLRAVSARL
jgi:hypothetical protein